MADSRSLPPAAAGADPSRRNRTGFLALLGLALLLLACDGDTLLNPEDRPPPADEPPRVEVALQVQAPDRFEITDSVTIGVTALDPTGATAMARVGYTAIVHLDGGATRRAFSAQREFPQGAPGDTVTVGFTLEPEWLTAAGLPAAFELEVYGWAVNGAGDCRAAVREPAGTSFGCRLTEVQNQSFTVGEARAPRLSTWGSRAGPPSSPPPRWWWETLRWTPSGGTSISHVVLAGTHREVVSRRPQFVAQDAHGRIPYSTRPTPVAPRGTVRSVRNQAGWGESKTRILARLGQVGVREVVDVVKEEMSVVVAHADSVVFFLDGRIEVFDYRTGFPNNILRSGVRLPLDAPRQITAQSGSNVRYIRDAAWQLDNVSFADTTYVATSRGQNWVAFGDGGGSPRWEESPSGTRGRGPSPVASPWGLW